MERPPFSLPLVAAKAHGARSITLHLPDGHSLRLTESAARTSLLNLQYALELASPPAASACAVAVLRVKRRHLLRLFRQRLRSCLDISIKGVASPCLLAVILLPLVWAALSLPIVVILAVGETQRIAQYAVLAALAAAPVSLMFARQLLAGERQQHRRTHSLSLHLV